MIEQFCFRISDIPDTVLDSELAVKLHGVLMNRIQPDLAARFHTQSLRPYALSVFPTEQNGVYSGKLHILHEAAASLADALLAEENVFIGGLRKPVPIAVTQQETLYLRAETDSLCSSRLRICFLTPAMYKVKSLPCSFPDLPRLFHSVLVKMRQFEGVNISDDVLRQVLSEIRIYNWKLQSAAYKITGRAEHGMMGMIECTLPQEESANRLLKTVFRYASYCGIGAKTALGMGSISVETI